MKHGFISSICICVIKSSLLTYSFIMYVIERQTGNFLVIHCIVFYEATFVEGPLHLFHAVIPLRVDLQANVKPVG